MRLDRAITLTLVHPLHRAWSAVCRGPLASSLQPSAFPRVPILMYHSISDEPEPGVSPYYQTRTAPAIFRQHMQFLAYHGYQTITVGELVGLLTTDHEPRTTGPQDNGTTAYGTTDRRTRDYKSTYATNRSLHHSINPPIHRSTNPSLHHSSNPSLPLVVITFDDGLRNFYTNALPVLQEHGFTATVFLPTAFIGDTRRTFRLSTLNSRLSTAAECLTWSEIRELRKHEIEFGSHTVNHPELIRLSWADIKSEVSDSKSEIEDRLGEAVATFCYPFAFPQANRDFAQAFRDLLLQTGYTCCATTELGRVRRGDDPFRLKRLPANSLDNAEFLAAKLEGSYDWLAGPQAVVKTLKRA